MIKEVARQVTVTVTQRFCDICEKAVEEDSVYLSIRADREINTAYIKSREEKIDVCSIDCLTKNIQGVDLLFRSKIIPAVPQYEKYPDQPSQRKASQSLTYLK